MAFVEAAVGGPARIRPAPHGRAGIWEVAACGAAFVLKVHAGERKFRQELAVYEEWVPRLPAQVPRLVAASGAPTRALLITRVAGDSLARASLPIDEDLAAYRAAGEFLRALHGLPIPDLDPVPPRDAYRQRFAAWCRRGRGHLAPSDLEWAEREFAGGALLDGLRRVPCHRDFGPENWVVARDGDGPRWGLVDFEHSRLDLGLVDILRLRAGPWRQRPERAAAFFLGYGRALDDLDRARLRPLEILHALSTTLWGLEHDDDAFAAEGRALIARLRAEHS